MTWPWGGPQPFPPYQPPFHPMPPFPQANPQQHPQQLSQHPQQRPPPQPLRPPPPPPHFFNTFPGFPPPFHAPPQHPPLTHQQLAHQQLTHQRPHIPQFPQTNPYQTKPSHQQHPQPSRMPSQKPNGATPKHQKPGIPPERHSRDLVTAQETARRLGTNLPGNTEDEIRRWVEARKKNWPSRANVARKIEAARQKESRKRGVRTDTKVSADNAAVGALAKLAEYGSSDDEGEVKDKKDKGETPVKGEKGKEEGRRERRGRRKRTRGRRRGRGVEKGNRGQMPARKTQPLLKMLLKQEIQRESAVLLQAFRFLVRQRRSEVQKGEKAATMGR